MKRFGKILAVFLAFFALIFGGFGVISLIRAPYAPGWAAALVFGLLCAGLTFFWFQFRPLSK